MSWAVGFDTTWNRDIGYGVPALCDHPGCDKLIDRGLAHVCGAEPYGGDDGCGLYFCEEHHSHCRFAGDEVEAHSLCERCAKGKKPFEAKRDVAEWIRHKETDESWAEWRAERAAKP